MLQKLKFDDPFQISRILQFRIQEIVFKLWTQQSAGGKSQECNQLRFEPQLNKFSL